MLRSSKALLFAAATCAAGFAVLLAAAYGWGFARWADGAALDGFIALQPVLGTDYLSRIAHLADPGGYALAGIALVAWALVRGRPRNAAAVAALLLSTAFASQLLQHLLAHPRPHALIDIEEISASAFPSGHATAAMSLALAAVIAAPAAWRATVAALGTLFALAVGCSVIALGWHFPSDVLGGYLLAAGIAFAVCSLLRTERETAAAAVGGPIAVAGVAALGVAAFTLPRLPDTAAYASAHTSAVAASLGLVLAAAALVASVALADRRG